MSDERGQSLFVIVYPGMETADQVYHTLRELEKRDKLDIKTAATIHLKEGGKLRLKLRWTGLPPKTALTAIVFERPTPDGPWVQPRDLALFRTVSGSGEEAFSVPLARACTPTEVRVDVYLDGARVESVTGPGGAPTC